MGTSGITTVLGPNARLEEGKTSINLSRRRGIFYIDFFTATYPGGAGAALIATRRRRQMSELEAITAPTHDAPTTPIRDYLPEMETSSDTPALPIHDSTISDS